MAKTLRQALSPAVATAAAGFMALALLAPFTALAAEGGETATLEADCRDLVAHGVDAHSLEAGTDPLSDAVIAAYAQRLPSSDPALIRFEIY